MATAEGLRERKKVATREALAAAALRLAVELGPDRVTVDDIAAEADVSVRTFFNYFASKEQAMVAPNPHRADELAADLAGRPADETALQALRATMVLAVAGYAARAEEWSLREQLLREHPALMRWHLEGFAKLEKRLVEAIGARLGLDPEHDPFPSLVVNAALCALRTSVAWWRTPGCQDDLADIVDQAFGALAAGLPQPTPRRRRRSSRMSLV